VLSGFRATARLLRAPARGIIVPMSTLDEIEAAADALPIEQQKVLYAHLAQRLDRIGVEQATRTAPSGAQSRRGFPISQGRAAFGADDVARIEAEADAKR
jgi:hypothetical protein